MKAIIALEDGKIFYGTSFGSHGESVGEIVFNTSMTGYQEILTDPSYSSQIVTLTYPLIGNYGVNENDVESSRIQVRGLIVREACKYPSNFKSEKTIEEYLKENNIIGIEGIDTRALTRHIRLQGAMKAALWANEDKINPDDLVDKARAWHGLIGIDCVKDVTCAKPYRWNPKKEKYDFRIAAFDFGIKYNILRILDALGCDITVFPASTTAEEIKNFNPDGIFLSNGPGDPAALTYAIETIRKLLGYKPMFGICLGHQLLALAIGAKTYKLKFGHRGANHPVRNMPKGTIEITSQNHGFCVEIESIPKDSSATMTHINLNDHTCEGLEDKEQKFFCVQYHPEASPGPHDSAYLFEHFIELMRGEKYAK
ncbi:MAG: glutamine-hydrolyzing carbamoyl-phosphate synthase small subunit [Spirochaetes bacterium]|nr:glutamine-hydrolyzing carbamoyl-phosphate synthase small subunit [Spirochaetota bacterium]